MADALEKASPYPNAPGYPSPRDANFDAQGNPLKQERIEKNSYNPGHVYSTDNSSDNLLASAGVRRIEAINEQLTRVDRWIVFFSVFVVSYAYGLDGTVRYTYQVSSGTGCRVACTDPRRRAMRQTAMRMSSRAPYHTKPDPPPVPIHFSPPLMSCALSSPRPHR